MPVPADLERRLGGDLVAALRALDASIVTATPVAGVGYPGYRPSAYRLETADGRTLKVRRFATAIEAERAEYVARCLGPDTIPPPLVRRGVALITEWVEGGPPTDSAARLAQCGRLQGAVHTLAIPADCPHRPVPDMQHRTSLLERRASAAAAAGVLGTDETTAVLELARRHAPSTCAVGFILGDFCAENAIVRSLGAVSFVDHDTLAVDACDYDLARTWYRWPMTRAQRSAFLGGYAPLRPIEPYLDHFAYWAIAALLNAIRFRLTRHVAATAVPLHRLRGLVADLERGVAPRDAAYS